MILIIQMSQGPFGTTSLKRFGMHSTGLLHNPTSPRASRMKVIKAARHAITKAIQREIARTSLPVQTLEIILKIAQVDDLLPRREPPCIREVPPEICFWALNGRNAIAAKKDTQLGRGLRVARLDGVGVPAQRILDDASARYSRSHVHLDDVLDALAAAVTAYRGYLGGFHTLPEDARAFSKSGAG